MTIVRVPDPALEGIGKAIRRAIPLPPGDNEERAARMLLSQLDKRRERR